MGFLSDLLSADNGSTSVRRSTSPFVECIMVATVAGFALSHRAETCSSGTSGSYPTGTDLEGQEDGRGDFWSRHFWLHGLVTKRMNTITLEDPLVGQDQDPTFLFLTLTWRAIMLHLCQTAMRIQDQSAPATTETAQEVEKAAHEVLRLMGKLSLSNGWTVRSTLPIPYSRPLPLCFLCSVSPSCSTTREAQ